MLIVQLLTIAAMIFFTYLFFLVLGVRRRNLIFTKAEKNEWDNTFGKSLGSWFTLTNIMGTLTSVGTTYVFFIGSSKLFGYWTLVCAISIWIGAFLTKQMTRKILDKSYIKRLMQTEDAVSGVLASLFWRPNSKVSQEVSKIVKYVSLVNIAAIIWLDFSVFSSISTKILGIQSNVAGAVFVFLVVYFIFHFTIKYGLRGFVFADLFHSPIILISSLVILSGCIWVGYTTHEVRLVSLLKPELPFEVCLIFAVHVIFLNLLQVVVSEHHWLRVWLFRKQTIRLQNVSLAATGGLWVVLIFTGFFVYMLSEGKIGDDGISAVLINLTEMSPVFSIAFWIAGVGALFASADTLIYCFYLVEAFDDTSGKLKERKLNEINPMANALVFSMVFASIYLLVEYTGLPFGKVVFVLVPFCLNLFPAFILLVYGKVVKCWHVYVPLVGYVLFAAIGFIKQEQELLYTLAASFVPVAVSLIALLLADEDKQNIHIEKESKNA